MKQYFHSLAVQHTEINHTDESEKTRFISINTTLKFFQPEDDLLRKVRAINYELFLVYLDDKNSRLSGANDQQINEHKTGSLYCLRKVRLNDEAAINTALIETRKIINDIIARMRRDIRTPGILPTGLRINPIEISAVLNVFDSCYGFGFALNYLDCFTHTYTPTVWNYPLPE